MNHQLRILAAAAALLVASAGEAAAQFTGVVTPPPTPRQPAATARTDSASRNTGARDSANTTRLTDMKTWVDSATVAIAGNTAAPRADTTARDTGARDTTVVATVTGTAAARRRGDAQEPTMHDGTRAPDTATPLPTFALLGALALGAGLVLMRRDGRRA